MCPRVLDDAGVGGGLDAALADQQAALADHRRQAAGGLQVDLERAQVAVVDAEDAGGRVEGDFDLGFVVDFDQGLEAAGVGRVEQAPVVVATQGRHDEEDGIGAGHHGFVDLGLVHDEVLAQHRDVHRLADAGHEVEVAVEEAFVGQHRDRAGPGGRIAHRLRDRVDARRDHPGRGRGPLDLGDQAQSERRVPRQGAVQRAEAGTAGGGGAQFVGARHHRGDLGALVGDDFSQFVHGLPTMPAVACPSTGIFPAENFPLRSAAMVGELLPRHE